MTYRFSEAGLAQTRFWVLLLLCTSASANLQAQTPKLRLVTKSAEPFSFVSNERIVGFSIDLWEAVASNAGFDYEMTLKENVPDVLAALKDGSADVAAAALSVTADRQGAIDFSQPYFDSGLQILVQQGDAVTDSFRTFTNALCTRAFLGVTGILLTAMLISAHLLWIFERGRNSETFPKNYRPGIVQSLWWTTCTIITGGCENVAPTAPFGRLVAVIWMLGSIGLVSYLTATLTTTMTVKSLRGEINGPNELIGRTVGTVKGSSAEAWLERQPVRLHTFPSLTDALEALQKGEVKALVYDSPLLRYELTKPASKGLRLVGPIFEKQSYAFGLQADSPWRRQINRTVLQLIERGEVDLLAKKWLGEDPVMSH